MDAKGSLDVAISMRTAKACGPGTPGLVLSSQDVCLASDGDYQVTDTGESTHNAVNTIAQGRPGVSVEPVVANSCASYTAHEAAGAASTRFSLRPLFSRDKINARLGRVSAARMLTLVYPLFEMFIRAARERPTRRSRMPQLPSD
jgi:hypothetical protein